MPELTGIILTHNEAHNIQECIETLAWADAVLVFDSLSTDDTVALAQEAGARVEQHAFENYGAQRDAALAAATTDWVFFVDADERVPSELAAEIRERITGPERGWWVPRDNYIFGRLTRGAGWYPDYQLRVLHRASAHYDPARPVHELVILDGEAGYLDHALIHYNYDNVAQFHAKQRAYTAFEARRRYDEGLLPKLWTPISGALRHLWWRFITERGYRDGLHGLRLSLFMAYYEFQTWRAVARLRARGEVGDSPPLT